VQNSAFSKNRALAQHRILTLALGLLLGSSLAVPASAQGSGTINQLFTFTCKSNTNSCPDGSNSNPLIQASDGNFYGTTQTGVFQKFQGGTIFKLTPSGQFTLLFTFSAGSTGNFSNGNSPAGALVEGKNGFLFGTTALGGAHNQGVVFKINKTGTGFQVVHSFCAQANCTDGAVPFGLTIGNDGSFFGQTNAGGIPNPTFCLQGGCGIIYHITPAGSFNVLHAFNVLTEGNVQTSFGLIKDSAGNFFGIDSGTNVNSNIYKITPGGQFNIVFSTPFLDTAVNGLTLASNGKLFGALIVQEETLDVHLFEINPDGSGFQTFTPFFALAGFSTIPNLIQASDGNLWGTVLNNGTSGTNGFIFDASLDGTPLQTISFDGTNGDGPDTQLLQSTDGKLEGTTSSGGVVPQGDISGGVVFTLDDGLPAPTAAIAAFTPSSGAVGSKVTIRGSNFVGTTAVTFNGVAATFAVLDVNFISATVPTGATTGPITVTTAGGASTSTQIFTVR